MLERMMLVGGRLEVYSRKGEGTLIRCELPENRFDVADELPVRMGSMQERGNPEREDHEAENNRSCR
jgi:hypothetical protein